MRNKQQNYPVDILSDISLTASRRQIVQWQCVAGIGTKLHRMIPGFGDSARGRGHWGASEARRQPGKATAGRGGGALGCIGSDTD